MVQIKACADPHQEHERQVLNYLRATDVEIGLLLYFGDKPVQRRFVLRNSVKQFVQRTGTPR